MVEFISKIYNGAIAKWGKPKPEYFLLSVIWSICLFVGLFGVMGYAVIILLKIEKSIDSIFVFLLGIPVLAVALYLSVIPITLVVSRMFYHLISPLYKWIIVGGLVKLLTMKNKQEI